MPREVHCNTAMARNQAHGYNGGIRDAIQVVCPTPHKEEERTCHQIKAQLEAMLLTIIVDLPRGAVVWEMGGGVSPKQARQGRRRA